MRCAVGVLKGETMRLTTFTDYCLRVLTYVGTKDHSVATIDEIARHYAISHNHVMKVVFRLGQCGYLATTRGKGGGMRLARPPEMINIGDLVRDTEDNMDIAECFNAANQTCPMLPACALRSVLIEARKSFLATLDFYRLSDLLGPAKMPLPGALPRKKGAAQPATAARRTKKAKKETV